MQSTSAGAALIVGIAVTLNVLGSFVHLRLDFSEGNIYSMSPASKKVLRALPDPVLVKVFHSRELPPQVATSREYARDLLEEFRKASGGKVRVQFIDTESDAKAKEEALREGVAPVRFDIIARDRYEQREGFLGVTLQYREKKEAIPFLQEVTGLEYDLVSRIKTLSLQSKPALAFLTSQKALGSEALDPQVRQKLSARYEVKDLDLASAPDDGIPPEVQTALLIGPQGKLSDRELWLLDQFLLSGRSLGVAVDAKRVDMRAFYASDNDTGLLEFLAKHGVKVLSTIILDQQSQPIQISMQQGIFMMTNIVQYPPFLIAKSLSSSHPVTKGLDSIVMPFSSPLELSGPAAKADVLAKSSKYSWAKPDKTNPIVVHPFQLQAAAGNDLKGPFNLATAFEAEFSPAVPAPPKGVKAKAPLTRAARPGRLAVVGTSKILAQGLGVPAANFVFMLNLMDWLAMDADLISIRTKTVAFRPLAEIPSEGKAALRYALIFGPALLTAALGLLRWRLRARARDRRVAAYGTKPAAPAPGPAPEEPAEPVPVAASPKEDS